jgi:predicted pyridoxine 5'-phosphate oxidase superfamily flavin-nucleotide-binding protein
METNPFHAGEEKMQALAGEEQIARRNSQFVANRIPNGAIKFVEKQPFVIAASLDANQNIWVSLLAGKPGFAQVETPEVIRLNTDHLESDSDDILWTNLATHPVLGMLFIELSSRKRLKVNGRLSTEPGTSGFSLQVQECFPLCPRYIQKREVKVSSDNQYNIQPKLTGSTFTAELQDWIQTADTFFLGSAHDDEHLDAGHRGGNPGFVQVLDPQTLLIPDYNGNSLFNSLGNFLVNPRAGLLFVNFETGESLQLTGHAELHLAVPEPTDSTGGTGRYWQFHLHSWLRQTSIPGLKWTFLEYSTFNI